MLNLRTVEFIVTSVSLFLAYCVAVTIVGAFHAWVTKKMGDDTAEQLGFLSLNPFVHMDPLGIFFLIFFSFGWGRYIPINPFNISPPNRKLKLLYAYLASALGYFVVAVIGIVLLLLCFGLNTFMAARQMLICMSAMSHLFLTQSCPALSSFSIIIAFILINFIALSVLLGVLESILYGFSLLMYLLTDRADKYSSFQYYLILITPILLIVLFIDPLRLFAIHMISVVGYSIAHLLHMV